MPGWSGSRSSERPIRNWSMPTRSRIKRWFASVVTRGGCRPVELAIGSTEIVVDRSSPCLLWRRCTRHFRGRAPSIHRGKALANSHTLFDKGGCVWSVGIEAAAVRLAPSRHAWPSMDGRFRATDRRQVGSEADCCSALRWPRPFSSAASSRPARPVAQTIIETQSKTAGASRHKTNSGKRTTTIETIILNAEPLLDNSYAGSNSLDPRSVYRSYPERMHLESDIVIINSGFIDPLIGIDSQIENAVGSFSNNAAISNAYGATASVDVVQGLKLTQANTIANEISKNNSGNIVADCVRHLRRDQQPADRQPREQCGCLQRERRGHGHHLARRHAVGRTSFKPTPSAATSRSSTAAISMPTSAS